MSSMRKLWPQLSAQELLCVDSSTVPSPFCITYWCWRGFLTSTTLSPSLAEQGKVLNHAPHPQSTHQLRKPSFPSHLFNSHQVPLSGRDLLSLFPLPCPWSKPNCFLLILALKPSPKSHRVTTQSSLTTSYSLSTKQAAILNTHFPLLAPLSTL